MNTADQIEQAARKYAVIKHEYDLGANWEIEFKSFKAGAQHVLDRPELQKEHITGFFNWYQKEGYKLDKDSMMGMPTDELFTLYIEHLKQKQ